MSDEDFHGPSRRKSTAFRGRTSLFHDPGHMIAFAPSSESLTAEIDAIAHIPSPAQLHRSIDPNAQARAKMYQAVRHSFERRLKRRTYSKMGKVPLPRPYKKHWADIVARRVHRDFIYGRDEDYEFSERDLRVKTPCCGVICFHALELLGLVVNKKSFLDSIPISYYCLLSIGSTKRCTKIVHAWDPAQIKMDTFVHLSVDISEWREAPNNRLRIELWSFQDPEAHFIVGTVGIHIYNFIRLQHTIETVDLWSDGIRVGKLAYEVAFSYGAFGYGHSNQLKNFAQPIMETISHSMFPRIKLDERADIADPAFKSRLPDELKLFTYHSLILEVDDRNPNIAAFFGRPSKRLNRIGLEPKPMVVQQVEFEQGFPVHCKLHMNIWQKIIQADFNDMYGEFVCIGHKRARLDYLTNLVQGRMRDLYEDEPSPLFEHLEPKDLDLINQSEHNPNEVVIPKTIPCPTSQPYTIEPEDEVFQDKFPALRREQGYLARVFGLGSGDDHDPEADLERKLGPHHDINYFKARNQIQIDTEHEAKEKQKCSFCECLKRTLSNLRYLCIKLWNYVFPEVRHQLEIPEISVTVASPEGSTTNIYSYFSREGKDSNMSRRKVDRLVRQTTALIDATRKTQVQKNKHSSDSDSSDEDE